MKDGLNKGLAALVFAGMLVFSTGASANAADYSENVSAAEVEAALAGAAAPMVADAAVARRTAVDAARVDGDEGTTVAIPRDPRGIVELTVGSSSVGIGLPDAANAAQAVVLDSGAVTYPADGDAANTVIPLATGFQALTTIAGSDAPTRYEYALELPAGAAVVRDEISGGVGIFDANGAWLAGVAPAWAKDANGMDVPTHFEVEGTTLVQVVNHSKTFTYPIVADPKVGTEWWGVWSKLSRSETKALASKISTSAAGVAAFCGYVPVVHARVACGIAVAWRVASWIDPIKQAAAQRRCAQINLPWASGPALWNVTNEKC